MKGHSRPAGVLGKGKGTGYAFRYSCADDDERRRRRREGEAIGRGTEEQMGRTAGRTGKERVWDGCWTRECKGCQRKSDAEWSLNERTKLLDAGRLYVASMECIV